MSRKRMAREILVDMKLTYKIDIISKNEEGTIKKGSD